MTEAEARAWIAERYGDDKIAALERYVALLLAANAEQNLISKATEPTIWTRHILDSAQLVRFAPDAEQWLDVGSGPGLPGIVIAILTGRPMLLVEPRRRRAEFLSEIAGQLALSDVRVKQAMIERVRGESFDVVTARAYAPLPEIFSSTIPLTHPSTIWILPKGRSAARELDDARQAWQGVFHVEQSLTDDEAKIIVATGVRPR
ncbi:ribosomal RNA small subunit methyltransferase G [Sphingomonas changbaiensis NBRC 104936]|uniref:Ribosomal RNA small subunit methyltransferase G n=1 Tax=Sphingomonas changbaiensis NBRC 104936 TaxID=1219043 RepID=A0A0E9MRB9_9SPHN|nr:16S rRNA (guanine(527)-N(7))-methyltransferase RsmG [Sphingomonas changbaiensis]GAO40094.1 ribosomal RNA small subunit methyltransferase G [Sphingomonas changbaiensis NBRC 104936]